MPVSSLHRIASLALAVTLAPALGAQPGTALGRRVAAASDGEVRMSYTTRPEVCGDGRDGVSFGRSFYLSARVESYGGWSGTRCERGPARVTLTVRGHEVVGVATRVGGTWPAAGGALDLGAVSATEAASYFLSLVPAVEHGSRGGPLLAAAVADSANVAPEMLRLGRSATLSRETRRRAIHWSGVLGDSSMVTPLAELARASGAEDASPDQLGPGAGLEGAATGALAAIPDGVGIPALMQLAREGSPAVRRSAVFWLGENDDPRGRALVRSIAADEHETDEVRRSAMFAYGQGGASVADLVALYRGATPRRLREHMIFVLSQRREDAATTALIAIAREDADREMRKKALFWLAQRDDPRVTKLLTDLVLK
jgi:hypothetical protein